MYIFAVALQDGSWHHVKSYAPERAQRPDTVELWHKIRTTEDPEWTKRYHSKDPNEKAFGAKVEITFKDGSKMVDEIALADAHPLGARPFKRDNYIAKFKMLAEEIIPEAEQARFLDAVQKLPELKAGELSELNVQAPVESLTHNARDERGIF